MNNLFNIEDFPSREKNKEFWNLIENKDLQELIRFFMLNAARTNRSLVLNKRQIITKLAGIEAMQELLDFILILPGRLEDNQTSDKETDEDKLSKL